MRQSRIRKSFDSRPASVPTFTRQPMSAQEVRGNMLEALDDYNDYMQKHEDVRHAYEEKFVRLSSIGDPYEKKLALEQLTLGEHPRYFFGAVERLTKLWYWQEQCANYKVDDSIVLAIQDDMPYWVQQLMGSDHHLDPNYSPVKGKVYLPS